MQLVWQRRRRAFARLLGSGGLVIAVGACGGGKLPPKVEAQVDDNCQTNVEMSQADLKFCAEGKPESCENVSKDVKQVVTLKPKNQASADEVAQHLSGCQGKGEADAECQAVASALAKLDCKQ